MSGHNEKLWEEINSLPYTEAGIRERVALMEQLDPVSEAEANAPPPPPTPRRAPRYAARYYGVPRRWLEMWRRLRRNGLSITRCYIHGYLMQVVVIADKYKCPKIPKNYTEEVI